MYKCLVLTCVLHLCKHTFYSMLFFSMFILFFSYCHKVPESFKPPSAAVIFFSTTCWKYCEVVFFFFSSADGCLSESDLTSKPHAAAALFLSSLISCTFCCDLPVGGEAAENNKQNQQTNKCFSIADKVGTESWVYTGHTGLTQKPGQTLPPSSQW